mmetsp:Transcript_91971/g.297621  ORF Transcript_91971/g.297621 Transcript_91971/m.297621 type:complete len:246 (-) Transcript_91971:89-826(-)
MADSAAPAEAEAPSAAPGAGGESEEELRRAAIRRQAEADLAEFHERRKREIQERQQRNRERTEASSAGARPAEVPANLLSGALAAAAAGAGGGAGLPPAIQAALANPAAAAALQQALSGGMAGLSLAPGQMPGSASGSAGSAAAPPQLAVRVREAGSTSFRRVVLRPVTDEGAQEGGPAGPPTFAEVEARVCAKFRSARGPDGAEVGPRRLVTLVRLRDSLEVADDDDASLLQDGEELEATFAAL